MERAEQLKRRKEIYEALHPETKASTGTELVNKRNRYFIFNETTCFTKSPWSSYSLSYFSGPIDYGFRAISVKYRILVKSKRRLFLMLSTLILCGIGLFYLSLIAALR